MRNKPFQYAVTSPSGSLFSGGITSTVGSIKEWQIKVIVDIASAESLVMDYGIYSGQVQATVGQVTVAPGTSAVVKITHPSDTMFVDGSTGVPGDCFITAQFLGLQDPTTDCATGSYGTPVVWE